MADDDEYDFSGVSGGADALLSQWRAQNQEDEDDDDTSYFWPDQPPYDIEEKLREINQVHQQDETPVESDRPRAVTFNNRVQMRAISMRKLAPTHEENDDEPFDLSKYETGETVTDVETSIGGRSASAPQQRAAPQPRVAPPHSTTPPPYSATARSASPVGRSLPTAPRSIGRRHPTRPGFNDAQNSLLDWAGAALEQAAPVGALPEDCLSLLSLTDDDTEPEPACRQLTITPAPRLEPIDGPEPIDAALSPLRSSSMPNLVVSCVTRHQATTEQCMDLSPQVQRQTDAGKEAANGGGGGRTAESRGDSADSGHLSDAADSSGSAGGRVVESRGGSADSGHLSDAADSSGSTGGRVAESRGGSADSGHLSDAADSSGGSGGRAAESRGGSADSGHLSDAADSSDTSSSARSDDSAVESMDEPATSGDSAGSEPPVPLPRQARQRRRPPPRPASPLKAGPSARPTSPLKAGPPPRASSPLKAGGGAAATPERMLRRPRSAPCRVTPAAAAGRPDCAARGGARQRPALAEKVAPPVAARRPKKRSGGGDPSLSFQEWLIQHERERARALEERKHSAKKRKQEAAIKKEQSPLAFRAWLRKKQQQRCVEQRLQQLQQRELLAAAVQQRAATAQPDAFRQWLQRKQRERAASAPVRPRTTLRCLASLYTTHPGAPPAQAAGPHQQLEVIYRPQGGRARSAHRTGS